ncbi:MAG TPA: SURF1 family cytochrome oxidase biogenesis protein [Nakamurella sp.]
MSTSASIPKRLAFLLRPGWIAVILAASAFAGACFFLLAPWQFNRNAERSAQNAAITAALAAPAVPVLDPMSTTGQPPESALWHVVTATGRFDPARQVQVRLRQNAAGQPISEFVLPFRLASGETLLVDRGSVSFLEVNQGVTIPDVPAGEVTITGRVRGDQLDPSNRAPTTDDGQVQVTEISAAIIDEAFGARPGETFVVGFVQLTEQSPGVLTPIEMPQTDPGPFLSYALQWEAFGAIALIGLGVFVVREFREPRTDEPADGPRDTPAPEPVPAGRARRRPRDGFDRSQLWDDEDPS